MALARLKLETRPHQRMGPGDMDGLFAAYLDRCLGYPVEAVEAAAQEWPNECAYWPEWHSFKAAIEEHVPALTTDVPNPWKSIHQYSVLQWAKRLVTAYRGACNAVLTNAQVRRIERQAMDMALSYGTNPASIGLGEGWPRWDAEECLRRVRV